MGRTGWAWSLVLLVVAAFLLWPRFDTILQRTAATPMPSDVARVAATHYAWSVTATVENAEIAALREQVLFEQKRSRQEQTAATFYGGVLLFLAMAGLVLLWGEREIILSISNRITASAAYRLAEAQTMRVQDRGTGTVFVPPTGMPWVLEHRDAPQIAAPAADDPRMIELELWRQHVLAFAWCADATGSFSESTFVKKGITTLPACRLYRRMLITARVWEVRTGKGQKNDTGWVAGWSYQKFSDDLNAGRLVLPFPAGQPPAVNQEALSNASVRAASRRDAP